MQFDLSPFLVTIIKCKEAYYRVDSSRMLFKNALWKFQRNNPN